MVSALLAQDPDLLSRAFAILVTSLVTCAVITLAASLYLAYLDWRSRERERCEERTSQRVAKVRRETAREVAVDVDDRMNMDALDDVCEESHVRGVHDNAEAEEVHVELEHVEEFLEVGGPEKFHEHVETNGVGREGDADGELSFEDEEEVEEDERIWTF